MIDTRPWVYLVSESGKRVRCTKPKVNPLAVGLQAGSGPLTGETATHTAKMYLLDPTPPDVLEGRRVVIDGQAYRILKNGISRGAGTWKLFLRAEAAKVSA